METITPQHFLILAFLLFGVGFLGVVIRRNLLLVLMSLELMLNGVNVALVTGAAFGAPNCIRISYAASEQELREALRRHNTHLDDVAVSALKRGMSVLSLMTFLLSEATGCIGLTSPAFEVPRSCQYAVIDSYILNHIAFLNLFDCSLINFSFEKAARPRTSNDSLF